MTANAKHSAGEAILFPKLPYSVQQRAPEASRDVKLQQYVQKATVMRDDLRKRVMAETFGDKTDAMRSLGKAIKQHALDNLDHYLGQFIDNATAAGAKVHFAKDADQANAIAVEIARSIGAKRCVKSKSMVTEETHLVPALEAIGCETVETDLGEFILQIDDDAPSHIVTPMIHKDRTAVGRAFQRVLGAEYTDDPKSLTTIARHHLREKYRRADLGISGGNFLVAETGSVVICTNEGNGRFCTSAPKTHIAFVGIEKVVAKMDHLAVLLKLLARSGTGQPLTVYNHIMTGPKRDGEPDGPEQMHIILVDNGRSRVLDERTREMLRCIRCGACLNSCPVYRSVGGHAYGSVYSGPIGAILTPALKGLDNYPDLANASSLCGACYEACPVKIDIPRQLIRLRERMVNEGQTKSGDKLFMRLWAWSLARGWTYRLGNRVQRIMFRLKARKSITGKDPYANRGWLSKAPGPVKGWTDVRDLPTPPAKSFRDWWKDHEKGGRA